MNRLNPHISVDCVVFGFEAGSIKLLLVERERISAEQADKPFGKFKLPGSLIFDNEDIEASAYRTLFELTGLNTVFLRQSAVYGKPDRLNVFNDLVWLRHTSGMEIDRVVTVVYYALVKIDASINARLTIGKSQWITLQDLPRLAFDHNLIIDETLEVLRKELRAEPIGFELLPKKFTLRQLQDIYELILQDKLDTRNFRKKIKQLTYIVPLPEKEIGVNHKPAQLFKFDKKTFLKQQKKFRFII